MADMIQQTTEELRLKGIVFSCAFAIKQMVVAGILLIIANTNFINRPLAFEFFSVTDVWFYEMVKNIVYFLISYVTIIFILGLAHTKGFFSSKAYPQYYSYSRSMFVKFLRIIVVLFFVYFCFINILPNFYELNLQYDLIIVLIKKIFLYAGVSILLITGFEVLDYWLIFKSKYNNYLKN